MNPLSASQKKYLRYNIPISLSSQDKQKIKLVLKDISFLNDPVEFLHSWEQLLPGGETGALKYLREKLTLLGILKDANAINIHTTVSEGNISLY